MRPGHPNENLVRLLVCHAPSLAAIKRRFWLHFHSKVVFRRRMSKISSSLSAFWVRFIFCKDEFIMHREIWMS